jgi:hypothetical protein
MPEPPHAAPAPPDRSVTSGRNAALAVLALLLVVGAVLTALPYAIGYGLKRWLTSRGAAPVELTDVDFNPFTGRLGLSGLSVTFDGTRILHLGRGRVQVAWLPLLRKRVEVLRLDVNGLEAVIERRPDGTWVAPLPPPAPPPGPVDAAPEAASRPWGFALDTVALNGVTVRYATPGEAHVLRLDRVALSGPATWAPDRPARLEVTGALDDAGLRITATGTPFADAPGAEGHLEVDGLALAPFASRVPAPVEDLAGSLGVSVDLSARRGADGLSASQAGTVVLTGLSASAAGRRTRIERLAWDGTIDLSAPPDGPPAWTVAGALEGGNAVAELAPEGVRVAQRRLVLRGRVAGGAPDALPAVTADAALEGLDVDVPDRNTRALSLEGATVKGLGLAPDGAASLAAVQVTGLALGTPLAAADPAPPPVLAVAALDATGIARSADGAVDVASVRIEDLVGDLKRDAAGNLERLPALLAVFAAPAAPAEGGSAPAPKAEAAAAPTPTPVRVADLRIEGDSRIAFTDAGVTPPFKATLEVASARLTGLDASDPEAPAQVDVKARVGTYTELAVSGTVRPFAPGPTMDLTGTVRRLELPPFSPYTARLLGYDLTAGQMDADLAMAADRGVLSGENKLTLRELSVARRDNARAAAMDEEIAMPLNAALSLLRDRDDTIRLTLPVTGDLASPDVQVGSVINRAVGKALRTAALQYATFALQPFGALVAVVQLAGKATALRLDPVAFAPGTAEVDDTAAAYAERVAALLADRPRLNARLCGKAVAADREALAPPVPPAAAAEPQEASAAPAPVTDEQLLALAQRRAEAFRDLLVTAHGIPPDRLLICLPQVEPEGPEGPEATAGPRVDILI